VATTLSRAQIDRVVEQAWYVVSVNAHTVDTAGVAISGFYGNDVVYSGEGSKGIAYLQKQLANWPKAALQLDVPVAPPKPPPPAVNPYDAFIENSIEGPALQAGANWLTITRDDLEAVRQAFIARWGDVWKPNVYLTHGA